MKAEYHGRPCRDPQTGRYGDWWNPNGHWDWYMIGGRWHSSLKLKPHAQSGLQGEPSWAHPSGLLGADPLPPKPGWVDSALKRDIDWEGMEEAQRESSAKDYREWQQATPEDRKQGFYEGDYPPREGETVEEFVARHAEPFTCYAFLTAEGVWHARSVWDSKRWNETPEWEQRFTTLLAAVSDEVRLTVVDIHS